MCGPRAPSAPTLNLKGLGRQHQALAAASGSPLSDENIVLYGHPSKPYDLNWPMDVDPNTGKLKGGRTNRAAHIGVKEFITGKDLVWFVKNHGTRSSKPGCEHFLD